MDFKTVHNIELTEKNETAFSNIPTGRHVSFSENKLTGIAVSDNNSHCMVC